MHAQLGRRAFLKSAGLAGAAAVAGCAPAAGSPVSSPVPTAAAKAAWEQEWDQLVIAAKGEGNVTVGTHPGVGIRGALDTFEKAFPGVKVAQTVFSGSADLLPKVTRERAADVYTFDVLVFGSTSPMTLIPQGVFDPIKDAITRPDVTGDQYWHGGYETGFIDNAKQYVYIFQADLFTSFWLNTDLVKEGEVKAFKDLADPKWKGRILLADITSGYTYAPMVRVRQKLGDEWIKAFFRDQQLTFSRDSRFIAEQMVRGNYAIANGFVKGDLQAYLDQGLGKNLKPILFPEAQIEASEGQAWLFNRAPHPNAAKLFINWLLTKQGQAVWTEANGENSRRTDVPVRDPTLMPPTGPDYLDFEREASLPERQATRNFLAEIVR